MTRTIMIAFAASAFCAAHLSAQVGYEPARSPFRDLDFAQELTLYSGRYQARKDPAQVAPRSGQLVGLHYQWRAGGPASITADISRLGTERLVKDPERPAFCNGDSTRSCKVIDDFRWPVYFADLGLALNLTGARSFYRLVPQLKAGLGLATDFHTKADVGDFAFGTRVAFHWGAGISWTPGTRYQFRADFINHLYSIKYPDLYYRPADDNSTILPGQQSRSVWLNNPALTIGLSYLFAR